jgi:Phytanoyl-CoA dioxygenase (PhyH)
VTATATSLTTLQSQRADLYRDGIISLRGCFEPAWADRLHEDFKAAFLLARSYPGGTISRGPERYYFAVHPEHIRGFVDLISHPAVAGLCEYLLGTDYEVVELGFDVPLAGAKDQPWHRDFPSPPATSQERRLTSLAFNVTTVDVTPDLAPLEIALGTHFDDGSTFEHGMFPPREAYGRYEALASRRYPRRGDVSARTGLTVHRGTENHSTNSRAVLILGVVASSVSPAETAVHNLQLTGAYYDSLPDTVRQHLRCTVVGELEPIVQKHDIEGLMMGG